MAPNVLIAGAAPGEPQHVGFLARAFAAALGQAGAAVEAPAPESLKALQAVCAQKQIGLIVPTRDRDLPFFAQHREAMEKAGVRTLAPSPETVRLCQDRRAFAKMLDRYAYPAAPAAPPQDAVDISIDLLMDLEGGRAVQAVARERVLVVNGRSKVTKLIEAKEAEALAMRLGQALGLVGHNAIEALLHPEQGPMIVAVKPRFGQGSLLAVAAGLDSPRRILAMLRGDAAAFAPHPVRIGETLYRSDDRDLIVPGPVA